RAHVEIGAGGHRIVEREYRVGKGLDHLLLGAAGVVAVEYGVHERAVYGAPLVRLPLVELLCALFQSRAALAGPYEGIEREARHALRMALGEHRRAQGAGRYAVDHELFRTGSFGNVITRRGEIVSTVGNVEI